MPRYISPHFTEEEFRCKCGCKASAVDHKLLLLLEDARTRADVPFIIRSGCRCPQHNAKEGGEDNSAHITDPDNGEFCQAVDIATVSSFQRFDVVRGLLAAGFTRLGWGKDFIHVDCDRSKPQNVFFRE